MIRRFLVLFYELRVSEEAFDSTFRKGEPTKEVG